MVVVPSKAHVLQGCPIQDLAALARMNELEDQFDHLIMGKQFLGPWATAVPELVTHGHSREAAEVQRRFDAMVARMSDSERTSSVVRAVQAEMLLDLDWVRDRQLRRYGREIESLRLIALASAVLGDRATADSAAAALLARQPTNVIYLSTAARVAAMFGDRSRAQELLRETLLRAKAFELLHYPPGLDSLRTYPSAEALIRGSG